MRAVPWAFGSSVHRWSDAADAGVGGAGGAASRAGVVGAVAEGFAGAEAEAPGAVVVRWTGTSGAGTARSAAGLAEAADPRPDVAGGATERVPGASGAAGPFAECGSGTAVVGVRRPVPGRAGAGPAGASVGAADARLGAAWPSGAVVEHCGGGAADTAVWRPVAKAGAAEGAGRVPVVDAAAGAASAADVPGTG
ncbi:hypothetical protein AB0J65_35430, partial [Streptomyces toxytricini]